MAKLISASIDLSKIDKSAIQTVDKNGQPYKNGAKYLNVQIAINDEVDNYGNNCAITIGQTKEQRDAKTPKIYLGNGKVVWESNKEVHTPTPVAQNLGQEFESDLPF